MSKKNNVIEINGRRYDARTGTPLDGSPLAKPHLGHIDGITARKTAAKPRPQRAAAQHAVKHSPQPSKTLMRHAVRKPAHGTPHLKAHTPADKSLQLPAITVPAKASAGAVNASRLKRAKHIEKSTAIRRFAQHPAAGNHEHPIMAAVQTPPTMPFTAPATPAGIQQPTDIFEKALQHATTHKHTKKLKKTPGVSRRITGITIGLTAFLVLAGFMTSQNLPAIRMQLASSKAGFSAGLPGYRVAGYRLQDITYHPGSVVISYASNSDARHYSIIEQSSEWDSNTLRDSFVTKNADSYHAMPVGGRTVFIYGEQQASWVNAGVWYRVQSDGSLSDHQLSDLAASL